MSKEIESPETTQPVHVVAAPDGKTVWRCVHDGTDLIAAFETDGTTESVHTIVDFDNKEAMEAAIIALGLNIDPAVYTLPQPKPTKAPGIHAQ